MMGFIRKKFGPDTCDDAKLLKRTVRAAIANDITNFYGCCGSWSAMASVPALIGMFFGLPGMVPLVLFGGGLAVLGSAIPCIKLTEKIEHAFTRECKNRQVCPPGWDPAYFIPPLPRNDNSNDNKPVTPVLTDIFDPAASVILSDDIRAMPSIKLKRPLRFGPEHA